MEVTEANFKEVLPDVQSSIANATFISIDTEFTGLSLKDSVSVTWYDSPEEAYAKLHKLAGFAVIQFGLCTFHEDPDSPNKFHHKAYNFYIVPCSDDFVSQTGSLIFLARNGMNFNKVFSEGISNLKPAEREVKLKDLRQKREELESPNRTPKAYSRIENVSDIHKEFLDKNRTLIQEFVKDEERTELVLERCNSFQRLLLHQMIEADFDDKVFMILRAAENRNRELVVLRGGEEEKRKKMIEILLKDEADLVNNCGFRAVLTAIKESGKLVVGHNMTLDVLHTINQFYDELPRELRAFKALVHTHFPKIVDTKMIATRKPLLEKLQKSDLEGLTKSLMEKPFLLTDAEVTEQAVGYKVECERAHEAGYDAYITGLCFITMTKYLSQNSTVAAAIKSGVLDPYMNKLPFAAYSDQGGYFELCGEDPEPAMDHVFHMKVPSEWATSKIMSMYSVYGGASVSWLGKEDCLVSLNKPLEAERVRAAMEKDALKSRNFKIQSLAKYKASKCSTKSKSQSTMAGGRRRRSSDNNHSEQSTKKHKNANGTTSTAGDEQAASSNNIFEVHNWDD